MDQSRGMMGEHTRPKLADWPHRRFDLLQGRWVLVSPHRTRRPWLGQTEKPPAEERPAYDPHCYLCPGNRRASGAVNPPYTGTFVFPNDFAALLPDAPGLEESADPLLRAMPVRGECRVLCFSPRHDLTLAEMTVEEIARVVDMWSDQITDLGTRYRWVQVFENKGAIMGCSNPHPHGQVWAGDFLPREAAAEDEQQGRWYETHGRPLLLDYARRELDSGERVVAVNAHWVGVVPWWAVWPFEVLLMPLRPVQRLPDLTDEERRALAEILQDLLIRYDNLFEVSFPYSMGWHGAPTGPDQDRPQPHWQLHAHFYPPLLRSATVKKFMVGYEMLAEPQRDLTPEQAAERLRSLPTVYYKRRQQWESSASFAPVQG
ncbi:UDP-glucose--hexose-1-phosphate uridylyltransferase [Limisphaera ngatamarikiensis]|nr:UDP-glucose--hexose-1-phosphate uridylyltransferase [Limisphaera ngatamarikiensis]